MLQKFSTPEDQATAKAYIADVQAGNLAAVENNLDPSLKTPAAHDALQRMAAVLPPGPPTSIKLIGAHRTVSPAGTQTNTSFEYQWGSKWVLTNVAIMKTSTSQTIVGINAYPQTGSIEDRTRFTLSGKTPAQYAVLLATVLAVCLSLAALVLCIRTKGLRRKWLWIVFILFGFGTISANWMNGAVTFQPISFLLFGAGFMAPLYGPWTVSAAFPVGAIVFLVRRLWGPRPAKVGDSFS